MMRRTLLLTFVLALLIAALSAAAQDDPLGDIDILLTEAENALSDSDLARAKALMRGANALLSADVLAECAALEPVQLLLEQSLAAEDAADALSLLAGAQSAITSCGAVGSTEIALSQTYENEFFSFDYPAGWVLDESIQMDGGALRSAYLNLADSQETLDALLAQQPAEGQAIYLGIQRLTESPLYDPTSIDEVAERYPVILGVANLQYEIVITEAQGLEVDAREVRLDFDTTDETPFFGKSLTAIFTLAADPAASDDTKSSYNIGVVALDLEDSYAESIELAREIFATVELFPVS